MRSISARSRSGHGTGNPALDATVRLHASDIEHNLAGATTVSNLVAATATYIAVIALIITGTLPDIPPVIEVFVPLPLVAILCYHVTTLAAIMRRSGSAALLETELFRWAGLSETEQAHVGTVRSDEILDLRLIRSSSDPWYHKALHTTSLLFPYIGWYLLGAAATGYVLADSWRRWNAQEGSLSASGVDSWLLVAGTALSVLGWLVLATAALRFYIFPPVEPSEYGRIAAHVAADKASAPATPSRDERVITITRLHESDIHGNVAAGSMSITFFATTAAYIALIATSYRGDTQVSAWIFCLVALPLLLLQGYALLLVAGILARSDSARILENHLFEFAQLAPVASRNAVGTAQSDVVTDVRAIRDYSRLVGERWPLVMSRKSIALAPYVGLYLSGLVATLLTFWTAYVVYLAEDAHIGLWLQVGVCAVIYAVFWAGFGYAAISFYSPHSAWHKRRAG